MRKGLLTAEISQYNGVVGEVSGYDGDRYLVDLLDILVKALSLESPDINPKNGPKVSLA